MDKELVVIPNERIGSPVASIVVPYRPPIILPLFELSNEFRDTYEALGITVLPDRVEVKGKLVQRVDHRKTYFVIGGLRPTIICLPISPAEAVKICSDLSPT